MTRRMHQRYSHVSSLFYFLIVLGLATSLPGSATGIQEPNPKDRTIAFSWQPPGAPNAPYRTPDPLDQHRIVLYPGTEKNGTYPVIIGFHGQPKRGVLPRDYSFLKVVRALVGEMVHKREIQRPVLVLPVFRFMGQNWPGFDVRAFKTEVAEQLKKEGITPGDWFVFGHSGAAGCGGDGMNSVHRLAPKAVGFFDTCLGRGWQDEIQRLKRRGVQTINIHSVETAGFRPKQRPEYQSWFDFGRAYGPLGIDKTTCPDNLPGLRLRNQPYRCAATGDGTVRSFVIDTGEGVEAHRAALPTALRYFLLEFLGRTP
ncbi:MAG: hypothetical protein QNJ97_12350 [Myxococcota bacterium]|nr:hypothetical protein [Myxococcota bacterium]